MMKLENCRRSWGRLRQIRKVYRRSSRRNKNTVSNGKIAARAKMKR
jgi:hypothetical protein